MKPKVDLIHPYSKSSLSMIPDVNYLSSLNKISMNRSLPKKKAAKSTERIKIINDSPLHVNNNEVNLTRTKESSLVIKKAAKKISVNNRFITNSSAKNFSSQKTLPELNKINKEDSKSSVFKSILNNKPQKELKFIKLNEDLKLNSSYLQDPSEYKSHSWLENVVAVKDWKFEEHDLTESLRFCNKLIRDILIRLKSAGKENESILLDKIWTAHFEVLDNYIEEFNRKIEECKEKMVKEIKTGGDKTKEIGEKIDDKAVFEDCDRFKTIIGRVQGKLDELAEIFKDKSGVGGRKRISIAGKNLSLERNQEIIRKKSLDICGINILKSKFK